MSEAEQTPDRTVDWDAASYDSLADPQEEWGREVLERLELRGDETVLDAGCGSGRVTRLLVERVPRGRWSRWTPRRRWSTWCAVCCGPPTRRCSPDLAELELDEPVDVIFSNATFHWVLDHGACSAAARGAPLRRADRSAVRGRGQHRGFLSGSRRSAVTSASRPICAASRAGSSPGRARRRCGSSGRLRGDPMWLEDRRFQPRDPRGYLAAVCLGPHLERLPEDLHGHTWMPCSRCPWPLVLDYVRLNISAHRRDRGTDRLAARRRDRARDRRATRRVLDHLGGSSSPSTWSAALRSTPTGKPSPKRCWTPAVRRKPSCSAPWVVHSWDNEPTLTAPRPEQGLLGLRKGLALYANLGPVRTGAALVEASALRAERIEGTDLLVVRGLQRRHLLGDRGRSGRPLVGAPANTRSPRSSGVARVASMRRRAAPAVAIEART